MTPSQFLAAYREEMAPTLGGAYMDGFIARNREKLLKIIEPVVAMINAKAAKSRNKVVDAALIEIREIDLSDEDRDYFLNEVRRFADAGQLDRLAGLIAQARAQARERVIPSVNPAKAVVTLKKPRRSKVGPVPDSGVPESWVQAFSDLDAKYMDIANESGGESGAGAEGIDPELLAEDTWSLWNSDKSIPNFDHLADAYDNAYAPHDFHELATSLARELTQADPDAVTPEKDAIVWAAFKGLVNEKRRAIGLPDLEVTESLPFFGRRKFDRKEMIEFINEIKETRKSDWRLAEVLAMHFEVPEKKIVELLNEYNVCPGATVRTMASKCDPSRYKAPEKSEGWLSRKFSGRPKRHVLLKVIRDLKRDLDWDWMLAPTLAGHFGVPDQTIVEWLRFHKICLHATVESMASQCVVEDVESLPAPGRTPIGITLRHPARRDLIAMVTASANEPGRFQLTWADNEGPSGHTTRDTPEEAVRYAVDEGYRFDSANSSEAREMVERAERAREERAAEIESWLTESLPSSRSVGRIGDRGWGSEVAADKLTARSREMASVRHNAQMTGDHAAWSRRVSRKVEALLAARKHHHSAPRNREAVMMVESAEEALARELGGKEHIPLAIETYRWEQEGA